MHNEKIVKRKVFSMVKFMFRNMTLQHTLQTLDTVLFCLRRLPACKYESFIDKQLKLLQEMGGKWK